MNVTRFTLILLIGSTFLSLCGSECPSNTGSSTLDLNQFSGDWYMIAGSPVSGKNLSKCGRFSVKRSSLDTFSMRYTAISHRHNNPVAFNVSGKVGDEIIGNWQLEGSTKVLGPFKHIIISVDYRYYIAMLVCAESSPNLPSRKFSMIWSRERSLSHSILEELKRKFANLVNEDDILIVDHSNC